MDKLIDLLREVNELPKETKEHLFTQAGMTDSDFEQIRIDLPTLEDDIEESVKDTLTIEDVLNSFHSDDLLGEIFKKEDDLDADELNRYIKMANKEDTFRVFRLVPFNELEVEAQRKAIADYKKSQSGISKPTSDDCRQELMKPDYLFLENGSIVK